MEISKLTLKRIAGDLKKFHKNKPEYFDIYYNPESPLEIYFKMKGQKGTPYEGGEYLCKIEHANDYPKRAPDYYVYTPNGRFHLNKKICLTNSAYHQRDWAPAAWNLLTLLEGFYSIWHSDINDDKHGIGHLRTDEDLIKTYAKNSASYNMTKLKKVNKLFNTDEV